MFFSQKLLYEYINILLIIVILFYIYWILFLYIKISPCTRKMSKMNEIKKRMAKLDLNQVQVSKNLEGLHWILNQIEGELHKSKIKLSESVKKRSQRRSILGDERSKKGHHRIVRICFKQTRAAFGRKNHHISWKGVKGRQTILKFKSS